MRIKRPSGLKGYELGICVILGFLGGVYIWKPLVLKHFSPQPHKPTIDQE